MWLPDGSSLYDHFGFDWTLLRMGDVDTSALEACAKSAGMPLKVIDRSEPELRDLYEADAALIRPDQVVAWRSTGRSHEAQALVAKVSGR